MSVAISRLTSAILCGVVYSFVSRITQAAVVV